MVQQGRESVQGKVASIQDGRQECSCVGLTEQHSDKYTIIDVQSAEESFEIVGSHRKRNNSQPRLHTL